MAFPVRFIVSVVIVVLALQGVFTLLVTHYGWQESVDTRSKQQTIFQTEKRMAVYASPTIARGSDQPQVVILGPSPVGIGFRPKYLQPLLGNVRIHNIATGGQKFPSFDQLIELIYRQTPSKNRHKIIFVMGIGYGLIADTPERWDNRFTDIEQEFLRYGVFKDTPNGVVSWIPDSWLSYGLQVVWPFMVPQALYNVFMQTFLPEKLWAGIVDEVTISDEKSNSLKAKPEENIARINYYNSLIVDESGERTFEHLMRSAERIKAEGGHLVVVDLPTAAWVHDANPTYAIYQRMKAPYLARLENLGNVSYVDLQEGFADDDFYDGVHPRIRIAPEIARRSTGSIKRIVDELSKKTTPLEH